MKKKTKKKKVEVKKELPRLFIEYNEYRTGGEAIDPDERWTSYEDTFVNVNFIRLHREQPKHRFFYHSVEVTNEKMLELDKLFLCVVRYSTGDSFGHTEGAWHVVGVAPTYKVADAILDHALNSKESYKPWEGYFERFSNTEIHELSVV